MLMSLGSAFCFRGLIVVCSSYIIFSLCIKFLISVFRACIGNYLGLDINFNPFLRTSFCMYVTVLYMSLSTSVFPVYRSFL